MRFSYNWLKELIQFKETPAELSELINVHITEVESVTGQSAGYNGVIVAEILEINKHPNADKLHLVTLDIGLGKRVTVVCGAGNIEVGQKVPLAMVGAKLPGGEMKAAVIRGVESQGMICSGAELGLEAKSEGILVLDKKTSVGRPVQEYLEVSSDTIIDLKVLSNRPDHLSYLGLAREIAVVLGKSFSESKDNFKYLENPNINTADKVSVEVPDASVCPKYLARYVANIEVKESPTWLQEKLISSGIRPINNVVDISNFVMLELGQPVHTFDADKMTKVSLLRHPGFVQDRINQYDSGVAPVLRSPSFGGLTPKAPQNDEKTQIIVRRAKEGEKILALDGKTYDLNPEVVIIADSNSPMALAGLIGGETSGVNDLTRDIIVEVATFDGAAIRRGSKSIGLITDASMRFERGLQPPLADLAMQRMLNLIQDIIPDAQIATGNAEFVIKLENPSPVECSLKTLSNLLGAEIPTSEIMSILERLSFEVKKSGSNLIVTPPNWRSDVKELADIAEEVVRIWGLDKVNPLFPDVKMAAPVVNDKLAKVNQLKDLLVRCGFSETPSHSFIGEEWAHKMGLRLEDGLKLSNPLNQQWTHLIGNLWPNLLGFAAKAGNEPIKIFEIANVFSPPEKRGDRFRIESGMTNTGTRHPELDSGSGFLPVEIPILSILVSGKNNDAYRVVRGIVELITIAVPKLKFVPVPGSTEDKFINVLRIVSDREIVGTIKEISPRLAQEIDLPEGTTWAEIDTQKLMELEEGRVRYQEISKFPSSQFDISVELSSQISAGIMVNEIKSASPLIQSVDVFDVYQLPEGGRSLAQGGRSIALRIVIQAKDRTLVDSEIKSLQGKISDIITTKYRGKIR